MVDGTTAALTPSAVSLSATWDVNIIHGIGHLLADEVQDKKADILLAPTGMNYNYKLAFISRKIKKSYDGSYLLKSAYAKYYLCGV